MSRMLALAILLLGSGLVQAQDQREDCNRKAAGTKGEERTRIISECIHHNARINVMPPRLARMMECNQKAGDMTGDARIRFVDVCMNKP